MMLKTLVLITALWSWSAAQALAQDWKELGGEHFIVYFTKDEGFAKEVSNKAEAYYRRIASDLGYARYSEFWTWDKRVRIYIHPDRDAFLKSTNQPNWSEGMADYRKKQIISYAWSTGFLEQLLPHEMAHLIFRDFVGFKGEVPVWLDEGVAQWAEEPKREQIKAIGKYLLTTGTLLSVADMVALDIRNIRENSTVKINSIRNAAGERQMLALSGPEAVKTYYIQAISLAGFLIERFGTYSFTDFCRQLRDGKRLDQALKSAYSPNLAGPEELEKAWLEYISAS